MDLPAYVTHIKETHHKPLFGVCFDPFDPSCATFAAVGSLMVYVYECTAASKELNLLQAYRDANDQEELYAVAWTCNPATGAPWILVGGLLGVLKIIDTSANAVVHSLTGHGEAINEIRTHPTQPQFVLTASKDHSVRLWNVQTSCCVAVFGGDDGHRNEVLSVDWHHSGLKILSCAMDNTVKVWSLAKQSVQDALRLSEDHNLQISRRTFPTVHVHVPEHTNNSSHRNYVDCVRFLGDLVLSKSTDNCISLWTPDEVTSSASESQSSSIIHLQDYKMENCNIWYVRFAIDTMNQNLYCGNIDGRIFVWDLSHVGSYAPTSLLSPIKLHSRAPEKLSHPKCKVTVRQVCLSRNSKHLIAVCEDSSIWRWDLE